MNCGELFSFSVVFFGISVLLIGLCSSGKADFFFCWSRHDTSVVSSGNLPTDFLGPYNIFPWIFPIQNFKTSHLYFWQIICDNLMVSSTSDLDKTDDNAMSKTFLLDQPLIFKSILSNPTPTGVVGNCFFLRSFYSWTLTSSLWCSHVWCRLLHFNCLLLVYSIVYIVVNYCYCGHLVVILFSHFCQNTLSCYLALTQ